MTFQSKANLLGGCRGLQGLGYSRGRRVDSTRQEQERKCGVRQARKSEVRVREGWGAKLEWSGPGRGVLC